MKKCFLIFTLLLQLSFLQAFAAGDAFSLGDQEQKIFVNNRILATVNGKAISVIDLMKKMDLQFYRNFPQYTGSVVARFQYYQINWKHALQEIVDKELILADAEERKLPLSDGDIRQEMESMFGPNIILNLDKVGLTFEEAWNMVEEEIKIRRMVYFRANSKALRTVTPKYVRDAYEEYAKANIRPEEWIYTVISIRNPDETQVAEAAGESYRLLTEEHIKPTELAEKLKTIAPYGLASKVNISETFKHQEKDLSPSYKTVLATLSSGNFSMPIPQKSKADKSTVYRIFFLEEKKPGGVPPFSEVEKDLKNRLLDEAVSVETDAYLNKLRHHYHLHESHLKTWTPENFEPFSLK